METKEKKVIGYCRVSSEDQLRFGASIENQKERIKAYCTYKQYQEPVFIADEAISGRKMKNRPGLQSIIQMVNDSQVERIIIYSLSRLSRNTIETMTFIRELNKKNVVIHSLTEELNTTTAVGRFYLLMSAGLAELESDQTGERTSSVLQNKKANGKVYCKSLTGFDKINGNLIPIPEEIQKVKTIFDLAQSKSPYHISKILNEQKISTKHGNNFTPAAIKKIIKNKQVYEQHLN